MSVVTRFAPSPTGRLHVGNIRTALHNWLWARKLGGRFILRIDDTDRERSREDHVDAIREDLAWLGLDSDEVHRQSARFDRYEAALERLAAAGRAYPAYETAQELELKRKVLLGRGKPPVYDRSALALGDGDRARLEAEGRRPHWHLLDHDVADRVTRPRPRPQHLDPALPAIPSSGARTAAGSTCCRASSTIGWSANPCGARRGPCHLPACSCRCSLRWAPNRPLAHEALLVGSEGSRQAARLARCRGDARAGSADRAQRQAGADRQPAGRVRPDPGPDRGVRFRDSAVRSI
jgi:glutamyl-tRNA synthetase